MRDFHAASNLPVVDQVLPGREGADARRDLVARPAGRGILSKQPEAFYDGIDEAIPAVFSVYESSAASFNSGGQLGETASPDVVRELAAIDCGEAGSRAFGGCGSRSVVEFREDSIRGRSGEFGFTRFVLLHPPDGSADYFAGIGEAPGFTLARLNLAISGDIEIFICSTAMRKRVGRCNDATIGTV